MDTQFSGTFFLGGRDLEMLEIAELLRQSGIQFEDRGLAWGARLSNYARQIEIVVATGQSAYAVELGDDMPPDWSGRFRLQIIDHHGPRARRDNPTSLDQIMDLLRTPAKMRTRWRQLVSANDRGHIAELAAFGANATEIAAVRLADRRAQGVSELQEDRARSAIGRRRIRGRLTTITVDLPSSTAVADFICPELGGPGADRLLVVMSDSLAVFADGSLIQALSSAIPNSWWGGTLPVRGFWGARRADGVLAEVEAIEAAIP